MTTTHQYVDKYPIDPTHERLIVGTIHPHNHADFKVKFFYGSECSLWKILHEAFPAEIADPHSLDDIKKFLDHRKIAMSDMIRVCDRKTDSALDKDLVPRRLNEELLDHIRYSNIREVFFTSGFDKNAAFKLFYRNLLKRPITTVIREKREVTLDAAIFGRSIRLRILYSPSGRAVSGLSRNAEYLANKAKYQGLSTPVKAFRVDYYRRMFGNFPQ